jgi:hypothetical protein
LPAVAGTRSAIQGFVKAAHQVPPDTFLAVGIGFDLSAYQYRNFAIAQR